MEFNREKIRFNFLIFSWALYDLANQFFALNIVSLYFPRWLTIEKKSPEIFYSIAFGISMFLVAVCAPVLGIVSDIRKRHKAFLIFFTLISVLFTLAIGLSENIFLSLMFFAIANFGCQEAIIFYNALMTKIAPKDRIGLISGLGRMFGYSGAILALYITKPIILKMGYGPTFLLTAVLFLIFALPCMIFLKEESAEKIALTQFLKKEKILQIFRRLKVTLVESYEFEDLRNFFIAIFFGLCAVNTLILFMSVYATKAFGLTEIEIIDLIAFSTLFAILGSVLSGYLSDIIGYRRCIIGAFILWLICLTSGGLLRPPFHWLIGATAGLGLGSTWVVARALVVKLTPGHKLGEVFGLFNLIGYIAGIIGPLFWGLILLYFSSLGEWGYRLSLLSLILFILAGFIFIFKMPKIKHRIL